MSTITSQPARPELARKLNVGAWVITLIVLALVMLMRYVKIPLPEGVDLGFLPPIHASLNALAAVLLVFALLMIKQKKVEAHRRLIYGALACSLLFLLSYVAFHFTSEQSLFGDADHNGLVSEAEKAAVSGIAPIYYTLLISHIALAGIILPFILLTFIRAYTRQFDRHRRMARWVYPFWLYVAITGPIVYLMMRPYYG